MENIAKHPAKDKADEDRRRDFLLARLRCASLQMRLAEADLNSVGVGLRAGWVTPAQAWEWLEDLGATSLLEFAGAE